MPEEVAWLACVVAPLDHRSDAPLLAVSVTEPPAQNVVGPEAVIVADGNGLTVTVVAEDVALQPFALVIVTLKLPEVVTSIDGVVAPFDQRYDAPGAAVSVTEPPSQNEVGPDAVIHAAGNGCTVTANGEEVVLQPLVVTVTV